MRAESRQSGLTLTEMTVVIAIVAMLAVFGLPAVRALLSSFETQGGARAMISAALASARAIAAKERHYAGVRFQKAYDPNDPDPLNAAQYMVFIVHDPEGTRAAPGFRAVEGLQPIRLPDSVGVMDLRTGSTEINSNDDINEEEELTDTTTFSIVFSPSGKLVIHEVRAMSNTSRDDIFNTVFYIKNGFGMFIPDADADKEPSRNSFIIYDRVRFRQVYEAGRAYSQYLEDLADSMIHINPYTGTMINR